MAFDTTLITITKDSASIIYAEGNKGIKNQLIGVSFEKLSNALQGTKKNKNWFTNVDNMFVKHKGIVE